MRRVVVAAWLLCAGCFDPIASSELAAPDEPGVERPDEVAIPELELPRPTTPAPARHACDGIAAGLRGPLRDDVLKVCAAQTYDGFCTGIACVPGSTRRAFECLMRDAGDDAVLVALAGADHPVVRTYAREGLLRRGALSPGLVREALLDEQQVRTRQGCFSRWMSASTAGLLAVRTVGDRDALQGELRALWMAPPTAGPSDEVFAALVASVGDEPWIHRRELELIAARASDEALRGHARAALQGVTAGALSLAEALEALRGHPPDAPACQRDPAPG